MMLGAGAPSVAVVETLTGSPFGFQLLAGKLPLFDPLGWNPDLGLDQAIELQTSEDVLDAALRRVLRAMKV